MVLVYPSRVLDFPGWLFLASKSWFWDDLRGVLHRHLPPRPTIPKGGDILPPIRFSGGSLIFRWKLPKKWPKWSIPKPCHLFLRGRHQAHGIRSRVVGTAGAGHWGPGGRQLAAVARCALSHHLVATCWFKEPTAVNKISPTNNIYIYIQYIYYI